MPIPLGNWVHAYQPGDEAWVKVWKKEPLQSVWTVPHTVVLATSTAAKVTGAIPWIHHTRVKKAAASCDEDTWKAVWDPKDLLKVKFQRKWPLPMKDAEPCSSHAESWLANAWQKLEDPTIEISMDFHCQHWPLSLIDIIAGLFITGPTRLPGWGGSTE